VFRFLKTASIPRATSSSSNVRVDRDDALVDRGIYVVFTVEPVKRLNLRGS
jgi:hypothetical protein